jgi:hypothetical protein
MRWSKIKNIIILLLLIVNVFLLAQVGLQAWKSERNEREMRALMVEVLENNGITFLPQEVPGDALPGDDTITASTALTRFLEALNQEGYVCSQITALYAGDAGDGESPVWYIETDVWPWRFAVDGHTGAVTVAETAN